MTEITDMQPYAAPQIERRELLEMPLIGISSLQVEAPV
jgi:hypothetical protein